MKSWTLGNLVNVVLFLFVSWMLLQRAPLIVEMFKRQGSEAPQSTALLLDHQPVTLPLKKPHLLVFWATWCGPCKVELARINALIEKGSLSAEDVLAISTGEDEETVKAFTKNNSYKFNVALDPRGEAAKTYKVAGTPTLFLINEKAQIEWMTMGISPSLEVRLTQFLKKSQN